MFGNKKEKKEKRFIAKSSDTIATVTLFTVVDRETGVNYLITYCFDGVSVTPLYDEDGNILTDDLDEIKKLEELE